MTIVDAGITRLAYPTYDLLMRAYLKVLEDKEVLEDELEAAHGRAIVAEHALDIAIESMGIE